MACVTACASGLQYDKLIKSTRPQLERHYERGLSDRLFRSFLFSLFPHPARLRALLPLLWLYQKTGASRLIHSETFARLVPALLLGMEAFIPPIRLGPLHSPP